VNVPSPSGPGIYGRGRLDFTGRSTEDTAKRSRSLNSGLANGCLAMVAITSMMLHNGTFGTTGAKMWLPGKAPTRVATIVIMGFTPEYFKLPGFLAPSANLKFEDVPIGIAAVGKAPVERWLRWVTLCGFYVIFVNMPDPSEPGTGQSLPCALPLSPGQLGFTGEH